MIKKVTLEEFPLFFARASTGTSFQAQIYSVKGGNNVRVRCNWRYSELTIDPDNDSEFIWNITKINDTHVSLSPHNSCISSTIYASVRDDYDWSLLTQAPNSANWITAVDRNETLEMHIGDLMISTFKGFNGKLLQKDDNITSQEGHKGYRLRSAGNNESDNTTWFLSVQNIASEGYEWSGGEVSINELRNSLTKRNISLQNNQLEELCGLIN